MTRLSMDVDIVCVGFGPATAGFLTTISQAQGLPPLDIVCYERAEDIGFGVSGVVTRARGIRASLPDLDIGADPDGGAGNQREGGLPARSGAIAQRGRTAVHSALPAQARRHGDVDRPVPAIRRRARSWRAGVAQIWPGMPVEEAMVEDGRVCGVRLKDQWDQPGMDVRAAFTVVGDGPVGAVGPAIGGEARARMGGRDEDGGGSAGRHATGTGHGAAHLRLSGAGDLRLPVRASRQRGKRGDFRAVLDAGAGAHRLPLPAILHAASVPVAASEGRPAALVGREIAQRIGPRGRAAAGGRGVRAHRRRLGLHQRAHRQWSGRGLDYRGAAWPKESWNCCGRANR